MKTLLSFLVCLLLPAAISAQTLEWENADPGNVDGYIMYFSDDPADPDKYHKAIVGESNTSITFEELQLSPGVTYDFYVIAYNSTGESGASNGVTGVRQAFVPPTDILPDVISTPQQPSNLNER